MTVPSDSRTCGWNTNWNPSWNRASSSICFISWRKRTWEAMSASKKRYLFLPAFFTAYMAKSEYMMRVSYCVLSSDTAPGPC